MYKEIRLPKLASFAKKGGVCINRIYALIEILRYNQIGVPHTCDVMHTQKIIHLHH